MGTTGHPMNGDQSSVEQPGRFCPADYRYAPADLAGGEELVAETIYVVGGLYGNLGVLDAIETLAAHEPGPVQLVFNGDFHWFDIDDASYRQIGETVLDHIALRGNVEAELASATQGAGCGCDYPEWIDDITVARSNEIFARLSETAARHPELTASLAALPLHLRARVGDLRVAIMHGDAESLSGWGFAQEQVDDPLQQQRYRTWFRQAQADLFASSHTCLPVALCMEEEGERRALINNGAAGMPNFRGDLRGLLTRISVHRSPSPTQFGAQIGKTYVDAVPIAYDVPAWMSHFRRNWPVGSAAYEGYYERLTQGPDYRIEQAVRHGIDQREKCWYSYLSDRMRPHAD